MEKSSGFDARLDALRGLQLHFLKVGSYATRSLQPNRDYRWQEFGDIRGKVLQDGELLLTEICILCRLVQMYSIERQ